ncbi:hypothetical protein PsYK624_167720 [Phanerochaete sordida]|uniref:Secreted protein n=1 Tax=Phanerochaete sordida TaxID=48140 RepID=A0A9P3LM62_9APHY|nr:hypothetical protein PsYK624_167720 [Phanerochaete sordida]
MLVKTCAAHLCLTVAISTLCGRLGAMLESMYISPVGLFRRMQRFSKYVVASRRQGKERKIFVVDVRLPISKGADLVARLRVPPLRATRYKFAAASTPDLCTIVGSHGER